MNECIATQRMCDDCANSRTVVSENGFHSVCCFSQKKAMDCFMGKKGYFVPRKVEIAKEIFEEIENIAYTHFDVRGDEESLEILIDEFANLKKKYTEDQKGAKMKGENNG